MGTLYIHNDNSCPFCGCRLKHRFVRCPENKDLPCLVCEDCKVYFYKESHYNVLAQLAKSNNRKLNHDVYKYKIIDPIDNQKKLSKKSKNKSKIKKSNSKSNTVVNEKKKKKKKNIVRREAEIPIDVNDASKPIQFVGVDCIYEKKGYCQYMDDKCNPYSVKCHHRFDKKKSAITNKDNATKNSEKEIKHAEKRKRVDNVTVIVLTDNRKCIHGNHPVKDLYANIKLVDKRGNIKDVKILSAYCEACDAYFVLKRDFKRIKQEGVLLCQIEDKSASHLSKYEKYEVSYNSESRIHMLGYNVSQIRGYTDKQRKVILANIIENTNISKHEILSIIDVNIARHKTQENYSIAVKKWECDRKFVSEYRMGDIQEVVIDKAVIK